MDKGALTQLQTALEAVGKELASRVDELSERSSDGTLTAAEKIEYEDVVRLNDKLSLLKLEAEELWSIRAAS